MVHRRFKILVTQIGKFGVVGILGSALNYSVFYFLLEYCGINYMYSGIVGFLTPIPFVFFINRAWTFQSDVNYVSALPIYILTNVIALASHSATQWLVYNVFGVPQVFSQLFGIVSSAMVNFILARLFVFRVYMRKTAI